MTRRKKSQPPEPAKPFIRAEIHLHRNGVYEISVVDQLHEIDYMTLPKRTVRWGGLNRAKRIARKMVTNHRMLEARRRAAGQTEWWVS